MRRWFAVVPVVLLAASCEGGFPTANRPVVTGGVTRVLAAEDCPACAFGPRHYLRRAGIPQTEISSFSADPQADYIIDVDDHGSLGADGSVILNGEVVLGLRTAQETGPRHVRRAITLAASNQLEVRLTGKLGSTMRVAIIGGAKLVALAGGTVTMPGGQASLEVPAGALAAPTEIVIAPMDPANMDAPQWNAFISYKATILTGIRGYPDGLQFTKRATIRFRGLPPLNGDIPLLLTDGPGGVEMLPATVLYDPATNAAEGTVNHFSELVFAFAPNDGPNSCRTGRIQVTATDHDRQNLSAGTECQLVASAVTVTFLDCPGQTPESAVEVGTSKSCPQNVALFVKLDPNADSIGIAQSTVLTATLSNSSGLTLPSGFPPLPVMWRWDSRIVDVVGQPGQGTVIGLLEGTSAVKACDANGAHCAESTIDVVEVVIDAVAPSTFTLPSAGSQRGTLVVTGRHLDGGVLTTTAPGSLFRFIGAETVSADGRSVSTDYELFPSATPGTLSHSLRVTGRFGYADSPITFLAPVPPPAITSIAPGSLTIPTSGMASGQLTLTGQNLLGALLSTNAPGLTLVGLPTVSADGSSLTTAYQLASGSLAGTYAVSVLTAGGAASASLTTVNPPPVFAPVIASVVPASIVKPVSGSVTGVLTLTGTNFDLGTLTTNAPVTFIDASAVSAGGTVITRTYQVPANAATGLYKVSVVTPAGRAEVIVPLYAPALNVSGPVRFLDFEVLPDGSGASETTCLQNEYARFGIRFGGPGLSIIPSYNCHSLVDAGPASFEPGSGRNLAITAAPGSPLRVYLVSTPTLVTLDLITEASTANAVVQAEEISTCYASSTSACRTGLRLTAELLASVSFTNAAGTPMRRNTYRAQSDYGFREIVVGCGPVTCTGPVFADNLALRVLDFETFPNNGLTPWPTPSIVLRTCTLNGALCVPDAFASWGIQFVNMGSLWDFASTYWPNAPQPWPLAMVLRNWHLDWYQSQQVGVPYSEIVFSHSPQTVTFSCGSCPFTGAFEAFDGMGNKLGNSEDFLLGAYTPPAAMNTSFPYFKRFRVSSASGVRTLRIPTVLDVFLDNFSYWW